MAPEQARGEPVSPATDVFSLGATLLFAATGDGPYGQGDPGLLMVRAAGGKVERVPRTVPGSLRKLLGLMLDPRPERRPTAATLAGDGRESAAARALALARRDWTRRSWVVAGACTAAVVLVAAAVAVSGSRGGSEEDGAAVGADAPTAAGDDCVDLPYQPCGQEAPAPNTDGSDCIEDHADYDGDRQNGCEAVPDDQDGRDLVGSVEANIVPADDVDTYPMVVQDSVQLGCDGSVAVTLEAPPGIVLGLELNDRDGTTIEHTTASAGQPASIVIEEVECGGDDKLALEVVVRPMGDDRVASDYVLNRVGDF
jgi:hypothetical protein